MSRNVKVNADLSQGKLEVQTESLKGSLDDIKIFFYSMPNSLAGGFGVRFRTPYDYSISYCKSGFFPFTEEPPATNNKVWTFFKRGNTFTVECNGKVLLNLDTSECSEQDKWKQPIKIIQFHSFDEASKQYRVIPPGENSVTWNRADCCRMLYFR